MAWLKERFIRWRWPFVVGIGLLVTTVLAWGTHKPDRLESNGECWTLAAVPGPEDLVLVPGGDVALVSSQDRRGAPDAPDAIWSVPLDPAAAARPPRRLTLHGRDDCSFHPHGLDLVTNDQGKTLLYVINHHRPEDLAVARACFDAVGKTKPRASVTSVEVFELRDEELYFLQRLADPEKLTGGNDLVAEVDGDVWVTIPPVGGLGFVAELLQDDVFGAAPSKLAHFECERGTGGDARCTGIWQEVELPFETPPRYVNGIEIDRDSAASRLYLASTGDERILVAAVDRAEGGSGGDGPDDAGVPTLREMGFHCLDGMPDNLLWSERGDLLVATHADARRFLQHARSPSTPSPWKVYSLSVDGAPGRSPCGKRRRARPVLQDAGGRVSAASVAASVDEDFILGQVFGPGVARCRPGRPPRTQGETR